MSAAVQPISQPSEFAESFQDLILATHRLLHSCTAPAGAVSQALCFETAQRLEQPIGFLQTLSDLLKVVFEPDPPGSMLLNSNWDLIVAGIPQERFRLAHLTVTSSPGQGLDDLLKSAVEPRLTALGYFEEEYLGIFIAVCLPLEDTAMPALSAVQRFFRAGFSVESAIGAIRAVAAAEDEMPRPYAHAGVTRDTTLLPGQVRISVWCFLPETTAVQ